MQAQRKQQGFSLVSTLAMSTICSLWLIALLAYILPSYQKAMFGRQQSVLRSGAEAALDWGVNQLNRQLNGQGSFAIDDPAADGTPVATTVPSTVLNNNAMTAVIIVNNTPAPTNSYVYDPLLDPNQPQSRASANGWRTVQAVARMGTLTKRLSVILRPDYANSPGTPTTVPLFAYAMFGRNQLQVNGQAGTDSFDSRLGPYNVTNNRSNLGGDLGTNGFASLGGAQIGGNLDVFSTPMGSPDIVAAGNSQINISGTVTTNGEVSGLNASNTGTALPPGPSPIQTQQSIPQKTLPAVPSAPATAVNLGALSLSGNASRTLTAGDYVVSSISITGRSQLRIDNTNGPVNIYVQGPNASIDIGGNGVFGAAIPSYLRIWYGGSGATTVHGNGDLTGVIYAPNSQISISGNGAVYGAVVGYDVSINGTGSNGGKFHYDRALAAANTTLTYSQTTTTSRLSGMHTVSWQEQ